MFGPRVYMLILVFTFDVGKYCNEKKMVSNLLVAEKIMGFVGFRSVQIWIFLSVHFPLLFGC